MKLIYFAKVLDGLNTLSWIGVTLFGILLVAAFICFMAEIECEAEAKAVRWIRNCVIGLFSFGLLTVLCPTKREFFEIYGIGKTIEYVESNEKAQRLPDKVINILDAWLEDYLKDEQKKSE